MNIRDLISDTDISQLVRKMNIKYATWLKDRFFDIDIKSEQDAIFVDMTLLNSSKTFFYPVESRIEIKSQNLDAVNAAKFLISYIESYFDEFFDQDEEVLLPIDWKDYNCEGVDFQLKGRIKNQYIENLADRLLAGEEISEEEIKDLKLSY